MSDDHTSQAWGIYGGVLEQYAVNKNIKRLAEEGVVLDNAFMNQFERRQVMLRQSRSLPASEIQKLHCRHHRCC